MYTLLGQSLYYRQEDNPDSQDLFGSLADAFGETFSAEQPPTHGETVEPAGPLVDVEHARWVGEPANGRRPALLTVRARQQVGACDWHLALDLGCARPDEVALQTRWRVDRYISAVTAEQLPTLDCPPDYVARDEDGLIAGRIYGLNAERVPSFVQFLASPDRRLPVVLVSRLSDAPLHLAEETANLACALTGLAHVIRLRDNAAEGTLREMLPRLACYDGAVRIYWPGFGTTDLAADHPFYHPSDIRHKGPAMLADALEQIANHAVRLLRDNPEIARLQRMQRSQAQRPARQTAAADSDWEELYGLYEQVEHDLQQAEQERQQLEEENAQLVARVRMLQWHLNNASLGIALELPTAEAESAMVYLSAQAARKYDGLNMDERQYWDNNLLAKLTDEQMRGHQSRPIDGGWVYPSSRTGSGRRLTYYCEGNIVRVCELFRGGEHDSDYARVHSEGLDPLAYDGFRLWEQAG